MAAECGVRSVAWGGGDKKKRKEKKQMTKRLKCSLGVILAKCYVLIKRKRTKYTSNHIETIFIYIHVYLKYSV